MDSVNMPTMEMHQRHNNTLLIAIVLLLTGILFALVILIFFFVAGDNKTTNSEDTTNEEESTSEANTDDSTKNDTDTNSDTVDNTKSYTNNDYGNFSFKYDSSKWNVSDEVNTTDPYTNTLVTITKSDDSSKVFQMYVSQVESGLFTGNTMYYCAESANAEIVVNGDKTSDGPSGNGLYSGGLLRIKGASDAPENVIGSYIYGHSYFKAVNFTYSSTNNIDNTITDGYCIINLITVSKAEGEQSDTTLNVPIDYAYALVPSTSPVTAQDLAEIDTIVSTMKME